jgi:hypothetical protein
MAIAEGRSKRGKTAHFGGAEKAINEVAFVTERIDKMWPTVEATSANKT